MQDNAELCNASFLCEEFALDWTNVWNTQRFIPWFIVQVAKGEKLKIGTPQICGERIRRVQLYHTKQVPNENNSVR